MYTAQFCVAHQHEHNRKTGTDIKPNVKINALMHTNVELALHAFVHTNATAI